MIPFAECRPGRSGLQFSLLVWQAETMTESTGVSAVGPRLCELRQRNALTLAQLSEVTGISVSTLSRLESGHRRPALELLLPLAKTYSVPLDELVHAPNAREPRVDQKPFTQNGMTFIPLTRNAGGLQAYKVIFPGGMKAAKVDQRVHDGYDWVYVLRGRLRLVLGDHDMVLKPGEVAEFETRVPHWFGSAGPEPVEILSLFGSQGERIHVRARTKR